MADKKVQETSQQVQRPVEEVNEGLQVVTGFWEKNKKIIIGISAAVIVIIGGWYLYKNYCSATKRREGCRKHV